MAKAAPEDPVRAKLGQLNDLCSSTVTQLHLDVVDLTQRAGLIRLDAVLEDVSMEANAAPEDPVRAEQRRLEDFQQKRGQSRACISKRSVRGAATVTARNSKSSPLTRQSSLIDKQRINSQNIPKDVTLDSRTCSRIFSFNSGPVNNTYTVH